MPFKLIISFVRPLRHEGDIKRAFGKSFYWNPAMAAGSSGEGM